MKPRRAADRPLFGGVTVHAVDKSMVALETLSPGRTTGLSVLLTADRAAELADELLAIACVADAHQTATGVAEQKPWLEMVG